MAKKPKSDKPKADTSFNFGANRKPRKSSKGPPKETPSGRSGRGG